MAMASAHVTEVIFVTPLGNPLSTTFDPPTNKSVRSSHITHRAPIPRRPNQTQKPALHNPSRQKSRNRQRRRNHVPAVQKYQQCLDVVEEDGPAYVIRGSESEAEGGAFSGFRWPDDQEDGEEFGAA